MVEQTPGVMRTLQQRLVETLLTGSESGVWQRGGEAAAQLAGAMSSSEPFRNSDFLNLLETRYRLHQILISAASNPCSALDRSWPPWFYSNAYNARKFQFPAQCAPTGVPSVKRNDFEGGVVGWRREGEKRSERRTRGGRFYFANRSDAVRAKEKFNFLRLLCMVSKICKGPILTQMTMKSRGADFIHSFALGRS